MKSDNRFDENQLTTDRAIKISFASPDIIQSWSYGEVKKPETINYRTLKPERGGLFCTKIFGPIKDYTCSCGRYKRMKYQGIVCEKCGVEVTKSSVRRERMGHINLQVPIVHIWCFKSLPSRISTLLELKLKDLEKIIYFDTNIVIDGGITPIEKGTLLDNDEKLEMQEQYGDEVIIKSGGEAVYALLKELDLGKEIQRVDTALAHCNNEVKIQKLNKHKKLLMHLISSNQRPEWMVLTKLPVLSPGMRPLVPLEGGRFASSDLNDLYRQVLNRNNRLKRLLGLNAPEIILRNEKRLLQEAVDSLLDNDRAHKIFTHNKRALKSLSAHIKGKTGRFRQNLLGKRVDYSGRSVITAGPELRFFECGLPKIMALELFKPFVYAELQKAGKTRTIKGAQRLLEKKDPIIWKILEKVVYQHPVILNRAPTLHRLGLQAFEPVLTDNKSIQLHPLVCSPFNADFDGDSMAVHIPLSIESQLEARILMLSSNNMRHPATGMPVINPSQDIILGLYYASIEKRGVLGEGDLFASWQHVKRAYDSSLVHLHARIRCRIQGKIYSTTAGRAILSSVLPDDLDFNLINQPIKEAVTKELIRIALNILPQKDVVVLIDNLMYLGFCYATKSGRSMSLGDMVSSSVKEDIISATLQKTEAPDEQREGVTSQGEGYSRNIALWLDVQEKIKSNLKELIHYDPDSSEDINTLFLLMDSGARGSMDQFSQICGIRGLMSRPDRSVSDVPILSNFKEGLTGLEYFQSISGGRKGLIDTAFKTANAGYLTRRLVDVAQSIIVGEEDCGTKEFFEIAPLYHDGALFISVSQKLLGRTLAEDIVLPDSIIKAGTWIDHLHAEKIESAGIMRAKIFSPVGCASKHGICAKCYGTDLSTGSVVDLGTAVGITAATSLGEPATQLTMRTMHTGGVATGLAKQGSFVAKSRCIPEFASLTVTSSGGITYAVSSLGKLELWDEDKVNVIEETIVPYGAVLYFRNGELVEAENELFTYNPDYTPLIARQDGTIGFVNIRYNNQVAPTVDKFTGFEHFKVLKDGHPAPKIEIRDEKSMFETYTLVGGHTILVQEGQKVAAGDIICKLMKPAEEMHTRDIVGGLPAAINLFEARKPTHPVIRAEINGVVSFQAGSRGSTNLIITGDNEATQVIPKVDMSKLVVKQGTRVKAKATVVNGVEDPHEVMRLLGLGALYTYMTTSLQRLFAENGISVHDKHIEVMIKAMTSKVKILESDSIDYIKGDTADLVDVVAQNIKREKAGLEPIKYERILMGITKASLRSESFLSAASFQESDKALLEAALMGKIDPLKGIKESIIAGQRIPSGTGFTPALRKAHQKFKEEG